LNPIRFQQVGILTRRLIARLGGFLARKGDGEPGVKTIWLGMQRILDFSAGIRFSRELQAQETCV
jgi:hypothetical protein